jgi:hypothetical protein
MEKDNEHSYILHIKYSSSVNKFKYGGDPKHYILDRFNVSLYKTCSTQIKFFTKVNTTTNNNNNNNNNNRCYICIRNVGFEFCSELIVLTAKRNGAKSTGGPDAVSKGQWYQTLTTDGYEALVR